MPKLDNKIAITQLEDELNKAMAKVGAEASVAFSAIQGYLNEIQPEIDEAISTLDLDALEFIKDRIILHTTRSALDLIQQNQQLVIATVNTTLSMLVKIAIGAVVAA